MFSDEIENPFFSFLFEYSYIVAEVLLYFTFL
jgi:hypothetical protein